MLRSAKTFPVVLGVLLGAVVVGAALWFTTPRSNPVFTDADTIRTSEANAKIRDILWQPPEWLGDGFNTDSDEYEPALSPDGLAIIFVRGRPGKSADFYQSNRTPEGWTEPAPVVSLNTEYDELGPAFTPDGNGLYFYSDRPGTLGGYDIWFAKREGQGWSEPSVLGATINSAFNDYGPAISPVSDRLYFASNRPRNPTDVRRDESGRWPATVRESFRNLPYDIYMSEITERGLGQADIVDELSSPFSDGAPEISPADDFVYFASDRPGGQGGFDLYRARLVDGEFFPVEHLSESVNTPFNELDPALGMGGFGLAFSSDRIHVQGGNRDYNLYRTESREVYRDVDVLEARMSLAEFLKIVVPWLLLLLLLLALIALLRKLATDERWKARWRRLGLMAKCLLVSGLVHMLILALLALWQVSANLEGLLNTPGGSKVTLVSSAVGGGAISQIRGEVASSLESQSLQMQSSPAVMLLAPSSEINTKIESAVPSIAMSDHVSPAEVLLASAVPERQTLSDAMSDNALDQPSDMAVGLPSAQPREQVAEQSVSSESITRQADAATMSADLEVPSSLLTLSQNPALTPVEITNQSDSVLNPVSIADHSDAPVRSPADPVVVELDTANHPRDSLALPSVVQQDRAEHESELVADAAVQPVITQIADVRTGSSTQASTIPTANLMIADTALDVGSNFDASVVSRSYEGNEAVGIAPDTLNNIALPTTVEASHHESAEQIIAAADIVNELEYADTPAIQLITDDTEHQRGFELETDRINDEAFTDAAAIMPEYRRSNPTATQFSSEADLGWLEIDVALPASIAIPEQVASPRHFSGVVTDAITGQPIADALVKIDSDMGGLVETRTAANGTFSLEPDFDADFVAVTASRSGYAPDALNLPIGDLERGVVREIRLNPIRDAVIAIEDDPEVHHLGDDSFGGRINSQFQKESEGNEFSAEFTLSTDQHASLGELAAVTLMAKGLQTNNIVRINGHRVSKRLNGSPNDGSFGLYAATFPAQWLDEGDNTIEIESRVSSGDDHDDFEIVNIQIMLDPPERAPRRSPRSGQGTL